jgi:hypothetical protein
MKKYTRIGLMVLVTLILTLALVIPGLADDPTLGDCIMDYPASTSAGTTGPEYIRLPLSGQTTFVGWNAENTTLINICEGEVPFGEPAVGKGKLTFYTYEELATLDFFVVTDDYTYASYDTYGGTVRVFDEDGTEYTSTYWIGKIYPEGTFVFIKEYTP